MNPSDPKPEPCNHEVGRTITCRMGTLGCSVHEPKCKCGHVKSNHNGGQACSTSSCDCRRFEPSAVSAEPTGEDLLSDAFARAANESQHGYTAHTGPPYRPRHVNCDKCNELIPAAPAAPEAPESLSPRDPHKTIPIKVWVDVDERIAALVMRLNMIDGVRTFASCQGTIGEGGPEPYRPYVMALWPESAESLLRETFELEPLGPNWGYIRPRQDLGAPVATASSARESLENGDHLSDDHVARDTAWWIRRMDEFAAAERQRVAELEREKSDFGDLVSANLAKIQHLTKVGFEIAADKDRQHKRADELETKAAYWKEQAENAWICRNTEKERAEAAEAKLRDAEKLFDRCLSALPSNYPITKEAIKAWLSLNQTQAKQSETPESPEERGRKNVPST